MQPAHVLLQQKIPSHVAPPPGISGSVGSLVCVKRSNSGRGPAKPIRAREKQLVIKGLVFVKQSLYRIIEFFI